MPTINRIGDDNDGLLWVAPTDHKGNFMERRIGHAPYIEDIYKVIDRGGVIKIKFSFEYLNEKITETIYRRNLTRNELMKLSDKGLDVTENTAQHFVEFIHQQEDEFTAQNLHEGIGWYDLKGGADGETTEIFRGYKALGLNSEYCGEYPIKPHGSIKKLRGFVKNHIYGTPLTLAMAIGLSSVLVGYLGNKIQCGCIVAHLYGDSTTGKTTATKLAISMGSLPNFNENSLLNTYDGTENALLAAILGNNGFPVGFDEANMFVQKDFSTFIYRLASGRGKKRLSRDAKQKTLETYMTTVLSTGEKSLSNEFNQNAGKEVRVLQFGNIAWTKNKAHADAVNDFAVNNYGWPLLKLAKHILRYQGCYHQAKTAQSA